MAVSLRRYRRFRRIARITAIALAITFGWTTANAATSGTLRGTAVDANGAVLGDADVFIRRDLIGRHGVKPDNQMLRTDSYGRFSVELDPGFYDVCVMTDAFVPICKKISVEAAKTVEPRFQLKLDQDVIKLVADTFPTKKHPR